MDQLDIFRLLLIILLLSNEEQCDRDRECRGSGGLFGGGLCNINQIIIILLLLNPPRTEIRTVAQETAETTNGTTF